MSSTVLSRNYYYYYINVVVVLPLVSTTIKGIWPIILSPSGHLGGLSLTVLISENRVFLVVDTDVFFHLLFMFVKSLTLHW